MGNDGTSLPESQILVGRVLRPHGVGGAILVEPLSDVAGRFDPGAELWLALAGEVRRVRVVNAAAHGRALRLRLAGCATREEAVALRGAELSVERAASPAAPDGAFYYYELLGCECRDRQAGALGRVTEIVEDGGGLLLRVDDDAGRSLLVPFVDAFIAVLEPRDGKIVFDLPDGLLETCASTS